jgi:hypothetical protein
METAMTLPREPGRPLYSNDEDKRLRANMASELPPRPSRFEDDLDGPLQADPELAEGPAGFGRIAIYAIAAILIVCAVLYGMSQNGTNTAANPPPPANTAANAPNPPLPPVRNVTPGPNTQPGTTTGAATGNPSPAPDNNMANPSAAGPGATTR